MAGQAGSGSVGKLTDIHGQYKTLFQGIQEFQLQHSHIKNVDKFLRYCRMGSKNRILKIELVGSIPVFMKNCWSRRISRDLATLENTISRSESVLSAGGEERVNCLAQGFSNNLAGFTAEFHVACTAPDVVALSQKFQAISMDHAGKSRTIKNEKPGDAHNAMNGKPISVEVDVVAQDGHVWIEVKSHKCVDLDSVEWLGVPGHAKGLKYQIADYLLVSRAPNNHRRWQPPKVAICLLGGCSESVKHEIQQMGAYVLDEPGLLSLGDIPRCPPPPLIVNLDVTSMCALVSEVSHGGPTNSAVCEWAQRISHWEECLQHERTEPLLPQLKLHLEGKPIVAAEKAVQQFEQLLEKFSGLSEANRWTNLKETIKIYEEKNSHLWLSERVFTTDIPEIQQHVFGLGDHLRALTITANGRTCYDCKAGQAAALKAKSFLAQAVGQRSQSGNNI